jgi:hypothetical protein
MADIIGPSSCHEVARIDGNIDGTVVLHRRPHQRGELPTLSPSTLRLKRQRLDVLPIKVKATMEVVEPLPLKVARIG